MLLGGYSAFLEGGMACAREQAHTLLTYPRGGMGGCIQNMIRPIE